MCESSFNMAFTIVTLLLAVTLANLLLSDPTKETNTNSTTSDKRVMRQHMERLQMKEGHTKESKGRAVEKMGGGALGEELEEFLEYEQFQRFEEYQRYIRYKEKLSQQPDGY